MSLSDGAYMFSPIEVSSALCIFFQDSFSALKNKEKCGRHCVTGQSLGGHTSVRMVKNLPPQCCTCTVNGTEQHASTPKMFGRTGNMPLI